MQLAKDSRNSTAFVYAALIVFALTATFVMVAAVPPDDRNLFTADELAAIQRHTGSASQLADPTNEVAGDPHAERLGQFLFFDKRLSQGARFSCASCHQPGRAFTDQHKVAKGVGIGKRNTPTLLNAADNHWFFWDGRADTMWAQVLQVIENPREFGGDRLAIAHIIDNDPALHQAYARIFGALPSLSDATRFPAHAGPIGGEGSPLVRAWAGMTTADKDTVNRIFSNVGKAIAAYERRLVWHHSPFDHYARALETGDAAGKAELSSSAKRGLKLFVGAGRCDLCHSGPDFTDGQFHNLGLPTLADEANDDGRESGIKLVLADPFNAAGRYSDAPHGKKSQRLQFLPSPAAMRGAFKTPTLRNIALTAPYFHDGRFATLKDVMKFYAVGKAASTGRLVGAREQTLDLIPHFTPAEITDLVAFLGALNSPPLPNALTTKPPRP